MKPEGYRIRVGDSAVLEAETTVGLLQASRTLRQLLRDRDGAGLGVRRCTVDDWPSMPFRGVLIYNGRNAVAEQVRLVREIFGALKMNALMHHVNLANWDVAAGHQLAIDGRAPRRHQESGGRVRATGDGLYPAHLSVRNA